MTSWPAVAGVLVALAVVACTAAPDDTDAATTAGATVGDGGARGTAGSPHAAPSPTPPRGAVALAIGGDGPPGSLVGLEHADVVVEYPLAADRAGLFAMVAHDVEVVGPLRSATPSDAALALAFAADLATARATGAVVNQLADADLTLFEEHTSPGTIVRDPARRAPFNLYAVPPRIRAVTGGRAPARVEVAGGAPAGRVAGGDRPADEFAVPVAGDAVVTWTWDPVSGGWLRTARGRIEQSATGGRIAAHTVAVLEVERPADRPPVVADLVGTGRALVLRDGMASSARWRRADAGAVPAILGVDAVPSDGGLWLHVCAAPCASHPRAGLRPSEPGL